MTHLDQGLRTFGRRNLPVRDFLNKVHPETGFLPLYYVKDEAGEHWLYNAGGAATPIWRRMRMHRRARATGTPALTTHPPV